MDFSTSSGYEADVNKNNAVRQLAVNKVAQHVGSGTGTARKDGVPGTPLGRTGSDKYSYGHGYGHGYGNAYGQANQYAYAQQGYGYAGNAAYGYGKAPYSQGYANLGYAAY